MFDIKEIVSEFTDRAVNLALELQKCPELGFKEEKSSKVVRKYWEESGFDVKGPFGKTGLYFRIDSKRKGPSVCLLSELDAVISPNNPIACETGVAHACGHNIQTAQVYAAALALNKIKDQLCGSIMVLAVPAEEFLEIEDRLNMKKSGSIKYISGKPELYRLGIFKNVDMVAMVHAHPNTPDYKLFLKGGSLGFTAKNIRFIGKASHGATPYEGKNALQAATLFFNGINANRETFRDEESIRIHPIITKGGEIVNSVPDDVRIETYVRGRSTEAIEKGCNIVDRCAKASAMMMDCSYEVQTIPGYLPLKQDENLSDVMAVAGEKVLGKENIFYGVDMVGSTDLGDMCHLLPSIQATMGGFVGNQHAADFKVVDLKKSCLLGGSLIAQFAYELLSDDAKKAKTVVDNYKKLLTDEQYFNYMNGNDKE